MSGTGQALDNMLFLCMYEKNPLVRQLKEGTDITKHRFQIHQKCLVLSIMPLTEINIAEGQSGAFKRTFMDSVHAALVECLAIPENDKNIRLKEFDPVLFDSKPPYKYFIEITLFLGRKPETKKKLYQTIVQTLKGALDIDPLEVFILLKEQPLENWGIRGGIPANEVDLGFAIDPLAGAKS